MKLSSAFEEWLMNYRMQLDEISKGTAASNLDSPNSKIFRARFRHDNSGNSGIA
jgi:hypothetical protein